MAQRLICVGFFLLFGQVPFCAVFYFLAPGHYFYLIPTLLMLQLLVMFFWGDLLILAASGAYVPRDQSWGRDFFLNVSHRIRPGKVSYYVSREYQNNIYLLAVPGRSSIIIGDELHKRLTRQELEVLIVAVLHLVKAGVVWKKTLWTNLLLLGMWPLMITSHFLPSLGPSVRTHEKVGSIGRYLFFYVFLLQRSFLPIDKHLPLLNSSVDKFMGDNKTLPAIFFKISKLQRVKGNFWTDFLMNGVQIIPNHQNSFLSGLNKSKPFHYTEMKV